MFISVEISAPRVLCYTHGLWPIWILWITERASMPESTRRRLSCEPSPNCYIFFFILLFSLSKLLHPWVKSWTYVGYIDLKFSFINNFAQLKPYEFTMFLWCASIFDRDKCGLRERNRALYVGIDGHSVALTNCPFHFLIGLLPKEYTWKHQPLSANDIFIIKYIFFFLIIQFESILDTKFTTLTTYCTIS